MPLRLHLRYNDQTDHVEKIEAIKAVRILTTAGLKEAKEFVEEAMGLEGREEVTFTIPPDATNVLLVSERREQLQNIKAAGFCGYLEDTNDTAKHDLVEEMKQTLTQAIRLGQYGIAQNLLDLVKEYDH